MEKFELAHEIDDTMSEMMREHLEYGKKRIQHFLSLMEELKVPFPKDLTSGERRKILPLSDEDDCLYLEATKKNGEMLYRFIIRFTNTLYFRLKK